MCFSGSFFRAIPHLEHELRVEQEGEEEIRKLHNTLMQSWAKSEMSAWSELRTLLDFAVLEPVQEEVNILPFLFSFSGIYKPSTGSYTMDQNTTAMIIASQNQDYVDEGLAEYQDQIHKLQSKFLISYLTQYQNHKRWKIRPKFVYIISPFKMTILFSKF